MTEFLLTPEEAKSVAEAVLRSDFLKGRKVVIEAAFSPEAPYRTTLLATSAGPAVLVEAQGAPRYEGSIRELCNWLLAQRAYASLFIATREKTHISGEMLAHLKRDGVGLVLIGADDSVEIAFDAAVPALRVTPEPTLALGRCKTEVAGVVKKFNSGDRKSGLQEMCEVVERETDVLARKAAAKGRVLTGVAAIEKCDWNSQINILSSSNQAPTGKVPLVSADFANDLHSFRGARNLVDHKVRSKTEAAKREQQFTERMMMAPRLLAELLRLQRSL